VRGVLTRTSRTKTGDIEDRLLNEIDILFIAAGAVGSVGNAGFIGVFQELWEGARFPAAFHSSALSIARCSWRLIRRGATVPDSTIQLIEIPDPNDAELNGQ
jgi:hypothetical protein